MRRPAARKATRGQQRSAVASLPAPIGGWNAKDPIAAMPMKDAVKLLNFFPRTSDCALRGGYASHATGVTGTIKTLAEYNEWDGTSTFFAVDDNDVWDVTASGAASAQSATVTNGKFQYLNYSNGTNNWLMMFNGVDSPLYFDGTTWTSVTGATSPAITGLTTTNIISACAYKERIYLVEKDSMSAWYLPVNAVGGAATEFDMSSYADLGGYLMWASTWSYDAGDGPNDAIVFMTSEGQLIVYVGNYPGGTWALVGVYYVGKPIGRRSKVKLGGDIYIICQNGVFPISKVLKSQRIDEEISATRKIEQAFNSAATLYSGVFGWEGVVYHNESAMIFNIPIAEGGESKQYVMNTITGAWCEFDSWDAECFGILNDELYFASGTTVYKAWTGTADNGGDIIAIGKCAFNYFGRSTQQKRFNMFRPMIQVNGNITFLTGYDVDFSDNPIIGESTYSVVSGAVWDSGNWDEVYWASGLEVAKQWSSPTPNIGYCVSGGLKINTQDLTVRWIANDYVYEMGGTL